MCATFIGTNSTTQVFVTGKEMVQNSLQCNTDSYSTIQPVSNSVIWLTLYDSIQDHCFSFSLAYVFT